MSAEQMQEVEDRALEDVKKGQAEPKEKVPEWQLYCDLEGINNEKSYWDHTGSKWCKTEVRVLRRAMTSSKKDFHFKKKKEFLKNLMG